MSNKTYRVFAEHLGNTTASAFIGNQGDLFYDPESTTLRISDGTTAGGSMIGGGGDTDSLVNGDYSLSLESDGDLILPDGYNKIVSNVGELSIRYVGGSDGFTELTGPHNSYITISSQDEVPTTITLSAQDVSATSAEWVLNSEGKMICPPDCEILTQLDAENGYDLIVGVADSTESLSPIGSWTIYHPEANGAYTTVKSQDSLVHTAEVKAIADPDNTDTPLGVIISMYDGGAVWGETNYKFKINARMNVPVLNELYRPATPVGVDGDKVGDVIFADDGIYVCKQNYDGSTAIWGKSALNFSWS